MAMKIYTLTEADTWTVNGVVLDGVFRGDSDVGEIAAPYGYDREDELARGLDNHYINAKIVSRSSVEAVWDDDWDVECDGDSFDSC
ncbi:hypothetical protein [Natronomonas gomsonensis]|uniref:hypothetical protein n=1 Tax=Natronomonas gomsonensis TaxID=1046043 RepID=UPI0015BE2F3A|nr:hypothetical protein [Natronomonas gomsonensis]